MYDFDEIIPRKNTDSLKYDFHARRQMPEDLLPLWVADMDFRAPKEVCDALVEKSLHGIFGYSDSRDDYFEILAKWFLEHYNFPLKPQWLVKTPGVVYALTMAIHAFTEPGDRILIQEPVYYPFRGSIEENERTLIVSELINHKGHYEIDFDDFEKKVSENQVKLFILCNPHNPVGRVWTKEELLHIGEICLQHKVLVVADEIHADFIYEGHSHLSFATLKKEFESITVTLTSPSKTFNLAGLQISNNIIIDRELRHRFKRAIEKSGYSQPNIMGLVACKAAYEHGNLWLTELKDYLAVNLNFLRDYLNMNITKLTLIEPEGTYLVWIDCKALGLSDQELKRIIIEKAKLWLDEGTMFGQGGSGYIRINIACPRAILKQALEQLYFALKDI